MTRKPLLGPRIDVDDSLTSRQARGLAATEGLRVIQTVAPLRASTWQTLDKEIFARRPDVQLRVYGHYRSDCDLSMTRLVPHVRDFAADSLRTASNLEALTSLRQLEALSLGIYELDNFRILDEMPSKLHSLSLGQTRSRKPSLAHLARFTSLRTVFIEGHRSGIEVLGGLRTLEDVTLRSVTTPDLAFLAELDRMWSLDIKLGGTKNIGAIAGMSGIKYLEVWQVRGLSDLGVVSELPGLQNLFLQALPRVVALPSLDRLPHLRRVVLENMKGLSDFGPFETAPALEDFALIDGRHLQPSHLLPVLRSPTVCRVSAGFGSSGKNDAFAELRAAHGKEPLDDFRRFHYR